VFNPGKRHDPARRGVRARARSLTCLLIPWTLVAGGCGFWDDFRTRDYSVKSYFVKQDPLAGLQSNEGDKRGRALSLMAEPLQHGGTQREQDFYVQTLADAALKDPESWCRTQAIRTLGTYKDPRAVEALKAAFYDGHFDKYPPEIASVLRIHVFNSLGQIGNPDGIEPIVKTLKSPPLASRSEAEKQLNLDERLAAASALARFKSSAATDALVQVLRTERDVALHNRAHESLQAATGKKLPAEAKAWEDLLYSENAQRLADEDREKTRILPPILRVGGTEKK
jgi:HEAT repeat protein